ncbi:hypothetical protein OSH08_01685 [Kaistia geumhonensis]|uniref:Uncharacterized protein n=1 Tax=Kaistia geumhonensis TaxID=410839 RepID=A0ABU0M828_9HYPH|nr:hypothetical protein [Kaistia geumhonensis]MCX5477695.1 hypothetical protein [Kaistia geumhonensis]MDQ0517096.1 hypothetical protein [Kaistia geumhonensis]
MSNPVIPPVVIPRDSEAEKVNAPEPDSERAAKERKAREEALLEGDLPVPDIAGISEQNRAKTRD